MTCGVSSRGVRAVLVVCFTLPMLQHTIAQSATAPASSANPLLVESPMPFGYPRFDQIRDEHFVPAFEAGRAEELREIEAIANHRDPPTFENTIEALERSGQLRKRASRIFGNLAGAHTNPTLQRISREQAPLDSSHADRIRLNPALFARVEALYARREHLGLNRESRYLIERYYKDFVRGGARLSEADKARLSAINAELASLSTVFEQNLLGERNASTLFVETRDELAGLSSTEIASAAAVGQAAGKPGMFGLVLQNTTTQPVMARLQNRGVRARLHLASVSRNRRGGEFDNRANVTRLARLRAERAALLGYATHAAFSIEDQTAGTPARAGELLRALVPAAVANARREAAALQAVIDRHQGGFTLAAHDWDFYAAIVRREQYRFDPAELRPYLEFDRVLTDGLFYAAGRLYGLRFKERTDLPVYHPDVRVFDVIDHDGSALAIFILDPYARPSKRGGAWMNTYVPQSGLFGRKGVIANHLNIPKPPAGEPTLMTFGEVETMFHEFGHALHGMFSNVWAPRFSGTAVPRDFVEYPSQVNEMWATWPDVLRNYARHHATGAPVPAELLDRMTAAERFNQGYATTEYLASSIADLAWHELGANEIPADPVAFEAEVLGRAGLGFAPVPPRYHSEYFSHVFGGAYSAGYYSYIWAEVLDADTVDWIKEHGGLTRTNGDTLRRELLSRGGSDDAMVFFRNLVGREPRLEPLLARRGLIATP